MSDGSVEEAEEICRLVMCGKGTKDNEVSTLWWQK